MDAGFGKERMLIMHNDFVVVGPPDDPAAISEQTAAAEAFALINSNQAPFTSRGDDSGTHKKERNIWQDAAYDPNQEKPHWYLESGQGMGATLMITSEKSAYTLTDRATYLATQKNLDLAILLEGDASLLNIYHVITVNPERWPDINYDGCRVRHRQIRSAPLLPRCPQKRRRPRTTITNQHANIQPAHMQHTHMPLVNKTPAP